MYCTGKLLASFGVGWRIHVFEVPPSMDMLASPLQPFLFVVRRTAPPASTAAAPANQSSNASLGDSTNAEPIEHQLQECPTAVNAEQLADILQVRAVLKTPVPIYSHSCSFPQEVASLLNYYKRPGNRAIEKAIFWMSWNTAASGIADKLLLC